MRGLQRRLAAPASAPSRSPASGAIGMPPEPGFTGWIIGVQDQLPTGRGWRRKDVVSGLGDCISRGPGRRMAHRCALEESGLRIRSCGASTARGMGTPARPGVGTCATAGGRAHRTVPDPFRPTPVKAGTVATTGVACRRCRGPAAERRPVSGARTVAQAETRALAVFSAFDDFRPLRRATNSAVQLCLKSSPRVFVDTRKKLARDVLGYFTSSRQPLSPYETRARRQNAATAATVAVHAVARERIAASLADVPSLARIP